MKIAFLHVEARGEYARWKDSLARLMIESVKRVMDVPVVHLTDDSAQVPGSDSIKRLPADDEFLMPFKLKHLANLDTPFIFLDTDMLVTENLLPVFDSGFDVAMYWRDKVVQTQAEQLHMPYNAGFIACRNNEFFKDCYKRCQTYLPKYKEWFGDQIAIFETAKTRKYRVLDLPETWNHPPESLHDLNAKVIHYKGEKRKAWMPIAANLLKTHSMV